MSGIEKNLRTVLDNIDKAASFVGRGPGGIKLVVVTKNQPVEAIERAIGAGASIIGENRAQEARDKYREIGNRVEWHFIGHIQRNKVKMIVDFVTLIHSVDSVKLALEIQRHASQAGKIQQVLVQVNIGRESTKHGILPENVGELVLELSRMPNILVKGLMIIPPYVEDAETSREFFRRLFELREVLTEQFEGKDVSNIDFEYLSMGMSSDYTVAIEEGSNMVRVGTAIFGPRG